MLLGGVTASQITRICITHFHGGQHSSPTIVSANARVAC